MDLYSPTFSLLTRIIGDCSAAKSMLINLTHALILPRVPAKVSV